MTGMISYPSLRRGCDPGTFFLVELGVFVRLHGLRLLYFNGLRFHGGTPPRAPPNESADNKSYRMASVNYGTSVVSEDQGIAVIASLRSPVVGETRKAHGMFTVDMAIKNKYV